MTPINARKANLMKNKSYIGISFIVLVFGIIFVPKIIDRLSSGTTDTNRLHKPATKDENPVKVIGKAPKFSLTNQFGETFTQDDMKGKVYVLEFFFTTCPTICPIMNQNMKKVEQNFMSSDDFGIISITINPGYDTAEVLKDHAKHLGVRHKNWFFLTGNQDYIHDLSNKGFNLYAAQNDKIEDGNFEHSGFFALIDKNGNIRSRQDQQGNKIVYYEGLEETGVTALIQDIKVLLKEAQ
jgi:protein SCO1/2